MSDFYKKFLTEDVPKATPGTNKQVFLGAFGKHPGWDDHIEDLGLETTSLITAKVLFYVQGIGGEIDSGAWEKLDDTQRLAAFKHVFLWHRPGQVIVGRLWSSSDGKGRTRYPMVVCAHCTGVSLTWALESVLPRLEQIEAACVSTQSAADVQSILGRYRMELRNIVSGQMTDISPPSLDTAFLTRFAARPELGPNQEGWMRILYALQSQVGAYARGKFNPKSVASTLRPQQIRVPQAADSVTKSLLQWCNFFLTQVDPQVPLLLTAPLEEQWVDVTVGAPTHQEVFCLRASPKAMPLASEVPYNLTPEFRDQVRGILAALETGKPPPSILSADASSTAAASSSPPAKNRFLKWFGAASVLLAVAVIGLLATRGSKQTNDAASSPSVAAGESVVASARPPGEPAAALAAPSATTIGSPTVTAVVDPPEARLKEQDNKLAEEKRLAEEKAKAEAAARLKALADEKEKVRLAAEAEARRLAEEKRLAEKKAEVARQEVARLDAEKKTVPPAATGASNPAKSDLTNVIGMVFLKMSGNYWVGKYEVTQAEFEKVLSRNPSSHRNPAHPVDSVNWEDGVEFCRKLTALEGSTGRLPKGWVYSLPTEAQWAEFATGAELDQAVTSLKTKRTHTEPVGSLSANAAGLHDVRGNVWEWCSTGDQKVLRGGGFDGFTATGLAPTLSMQYRWTLAPEQKKPQAGFRCVLIPQP